MNDDFMNWLSSEDSAPYRVWNKSGWRGVFIRVRVNDNFDYIYAQTDYEQTDYAQTDDAQIVIHRENRFEYLGMFCKRNNGFYDVQGNIYGLSVMDFDTLSSAASLKKNLQQSVRDRVNAIIGNDRNNLKISKLTNAFLLNCLERDLEYSAASKAREEFLKSDGPGFPIRFHQYSPAGWTDESLQGYILDPDGYVEKEAERYINEHQEELLYDILMNEAIEQEYQAIQNNPNNPAHTVKRIISSMKDSPAKTVNVTILKNGTEFTFKTEAREFHIDCQTTYATWNIAAKDRKRFEELFGHKSYAPEEILRITYGKKVLYEVS